MSTTTYAMRDLVAYYIGGGWGKEEPEDGFPESAYVIRGTDMPGLKVADASGVPHRFHKTSNLRSRRLQAGDIVLEVSGGSKDQPVGRSLLITPTMMSEFDDDIMCASFCKLVRPDPDVVDPAYLYWHLQHIYDNREILQYQVQSTGISNFQFEAFLDQHEVKLPPVETQRLIAGILSAYDDLIETNTRRIRVLEEMARALYREWFVHYRFPSHEAVVMVEHADLGEVPEGWEVQTVKQTVKRLKAGTRYKAGDLEAEGAVPVIDQSTAEVRGFHNNDPDHEASPDEPIIIFGDHTCKMQLMVAPFSVAENVVPFVGAGGLPVLYLYELVNGLIETAEYKRHWTDLGTKQVTVAPKEIAERFSEVVRSQFELIEVLRIKNRNLRQTRDLLLPRLVSGAIPVEAAEAELAEAA